MPFGPNNEYADMAACVAANGDKDDPEAYCAALMEATEAHRSLAPVRRGVSRFGVELRAEMQGNTLHGHAAVFGVTGKVPGGWENLAPGAFDEVMARRDLDVRALINHDATLLLGRQSSRTLRLGVDGEGLAFEVDLPDTSYANDLRALVDRGDLTGASFGFIPGEDRFSRAPDGRQLRTHTSVADLIDVSAVTFPAYEGAGVALRNYEIVAGNSRSQLIRARARVLSIG